MEAMSAPESATRNATSATATQAVNGHLALVREADQSAALGVARRVVAELFGPPEARAFGVRYWTGAVDLAAACEPRFTLVIRRPGALRRMFLPPTELALAEAFVRGDFDVEGDLESAADLAALLAERLASVGRLARITALLLRLPRRDAPTDPHAGAPVGRRRFRPALTLLGRRHARRRDADAIRHHYDVGNDFYALWLDEARVYSCAYFATGAETLDAAQAAKLDLLCRKLRLRPGETLLDIGCGWGGLVRHAARHYGVHALGITLSEAQATVARERIREDGLEHRCRVEVRDYRDLPPAPAFDKVVSVGMFEHVGRAQLPAYFRAAFRLVSPGGLFLNHGIVSLDDARARRGGGGGGGGGVDAAPGRRMRGKGRFMDRYVFPDGELVPLAVAAAAAEAAGFETRDVESLREHYALTLRHWLRRLEAGRDEAVALAGEQTYRVWRLYMAASAHAFATAHIGVVQLLLAKPGTGGRVGLPWTRADLLTPPRPTLLEQPR